LIRKCRDLQRLRGIVAALIAVGLDVAVLAAPRACGAKPIPIDPAKLTAWFNAHAAALALYARQRLGGGVSATETQDVVQEAFVRLIKQCTASREPDDVPAWLFACVRNAAVDMARSESRRRRRERRVARERMELGPAALSGRFVAHPGNMLDADDAERLLASISADLREVVTLRIWGSMTLTQIAAVTGSPVSTVYDRYRAALQQMKRTLEIPDVKSCERR
jgi:RNA polymerase sigma-70 factor (ECF subfamily)